MINDFFDIFYWWFLLFILGLVFFPLAWFLFRKFFDKGYAFAKVIGVLIVSYTVWLLGSLKILPFFSETIWLVIFAAAAGNILLFNKNKQELRKTIKNNWQIFVLEEIFFFAFFAFWSFIRGFQPNIQGLEKFMDYGFVNSILRSRYFPPADMWLAGETINYYYFGHLISAVLTKLSRLDSAITYNLMMATIFALTFTAAFSLGANLIFTTTQKKIRNLKLVIFAGLLTAFLLTLGGNLHPLYWFITQGDFKSYWYPDATRFIVQKFGATDNTIHEFPIYSFVVADLHGHMIDIPNVLLILALLLSLGMGIDSKKKWKQFGPQILILSLCFAIAFMTNAWNYPIYFLVTGGVLLLFNLLRLKRNWKKAIIQTGIIGGSLVVGSFLLSLLFHLHFKSIAKGIALVDFRSPPWMLLVLWGFPLITTFSFLALLKSRSSTINHQPSIIKVLVSVLLAVSWFLILMPEVFYVKDIYIHSHQRANTMFKLTYQSFVMFSLASSYIIIQVLTSIKKRLAKVAVFIFHFSFFIFIFIYPYFAVRSYYGLKTYQGLDGLNYLKNLYSDDYQAILWLKKYVSGQPVIVEAVGESYTDFARVSANTGLSTILGWRVHEWLWRGSFDEPAKRTEEVKTIYESPDPIKTKELLNKYRVELIFIGNLERQQYSNLQEKKFEQLGEVIFSSRETRVYQIRN